MRKTFSIETETTPIEAFAFGSARQKALALTFGATRAFQFRYVGTDCQIPLYIREAVAAAGFRLVRLGGTTYKNSVWGLVPLTPGA